LDNSIMATKRAPKFQPPKTESLPAARGRVLERMEAVPEEDLNAAPQFVGEGQWLREKKSGFVHPWNEAMAQRSDLVELYDPAQDEESGLDHLTNFDASRLPPLGARI
jgi:hypothetical protein